jgi:hypothetical protein
MFSITNVAVVAGAMEGDIGSLFLTVDATFKRHAVAQRLRPQRTHI